MKVEYKRSIRMIGKNITPLEEQVVYDWLNGEIGMRQGLEALGLRKDQPTSFYQRVCRVTKKWAIEGNITIKKKDY